MFHKVIPLFNGYFTVNLGFQGVFSKIKNIPNFAFLIISEDGEAIVVDSGFSKEYIPGLDSECIKAPENDLELSIMRLGFTPSKIERVIQTHIHWDHTAGMKLFKNACFYLQAEEIRTLINLNVNEECSYCPDHWLSLLPQFHLLEGATEIKPGLKLLLTGGHTEGHQVVEVNTREGTVILGGDAPFNYDSMWDKIPQEYWNIFRNGPGKRFYWHDNIRPLLKNYLKKVNKHEFISNKKINMSSYKSQGYKFLLSHDARLLNFDSKE